ncbi:transcriptional regulator [Yinghuangia seranimata]|uniref:transcriptional regulator n=1 Tax=Yinghuangia seranimata TaxID=408067 RepID=UPI00248B8B02|nr:transcriptional regulator [Yinghuangia seranimata]MDI2128725.1 transcriptional regulator [Yinghuangia seranimata]
MAGNGDLRALVEEAGLTRREIARWVNVVAERRGQHLGCTHTSVARWLDGAQPRWPIPDLLAEVLGRRLGYELTVSDLGLRDRRPPAADPFDGLSVARTVSDIRRAVVELTGRDMNRRNFLLGSTFGAAAFSSPALFWSTATGVEPEPMEHGGTGRVREADVERIRQTVVMFRKLDRAQGGGDLRDTVVNHLNGVARTKLSGTYGDDVGRALFRAVAELTELAGWLSFDSGRHALAQRYHIQALRLAQAADDRAYGAYVMANMACQAVYLGHGWEAVQLARAAQQGARGALTHRGAALVLAMEARGHAALSDERACVEALSAAERSLDAADGDDDPAWCQYFDKGELMHEFAHCHRDLRLPKATQGFARDAIGLRTDGYTRRCAQDTTFMAAAHLEERELDQACAKAGEALDIASKLNSSQCNDFLREFRTRLKPYARERVVRDFHERAEELYAGMAV